MKKYFGYTFEKLDLPKTEIMELNLIYTKKVESNPTINEKIYRQPSL